MKNHKLIILSMAFSGLLMIISIAQAQVYRWTDEDGSVGFTDDFSQVPEKYKKSVAPVGPTKEGSGHSPQTQEPQRRGDMMEEMVKRFPGLTYEWTQAMSLWIRVPAMVSSYKEDFSEMAAQIASHYHRQKGHLICVRFYYGGGRVIAYECR